MKKYINNLCGLCLLSVLCVSCWNDLDIKSIDPQSSPTFDDMQLLAKAYSTLGLTGQQGPAGRGDISSDEGESGFYRTTFNLQVLPTDECNWAWQTDTDIPQITGISWSSSSQRTQWCYQRLGFDIVLFNTYLKETAGQSSQNYKYYRAEVRFLRALHYWYFLDLWHKAPFKDENDESTALPVPKEGIDLYNWIDQELTAIENELAPVGTFNTAQDFGRVDQGAAWLLHARLALNSDIYTDGQVNDLEKAKTYATQLIGSGKYNLATNEKGGYSGYAQLFMADNDENPEAMQEIILPIRQDGLKTRCYSGANYLISSTRISGMPYAGTSNCWSCNYARPDLVKKFFPDGKIPMATEELEPGATEEEIIAQDAKTGTDTKSILKAAGDDRALFYAGCGGGIRKLSTDKLNNFLDGISVVKFQNIRSDGGPVKDVEWPDMDIPLLRFAEAYMIRAEVAYRQGDEAGSLKDLNVLRKRAHAAELLEVNEDVLVDEWCREFYMEGRRRSDLNRFGRFTGSTYVWAWKGGVAKGQTVDNHFRFYPIPQDDINNNENMKNSQNEGY